ncbi:MULTISPECIES: T9SS type A sorting domain-containing protein [Aquimarina]|uniref:T9SS type A sorting domain-containing protein n=1 Tax=Aquimarina TaxID=290174 RepID=UPI000943D897|nr:MULTISPECIES: T9SS type A sorting domain-containing protein [Aquimarina]
MKKLFLLTFIFLSSTLAWSQISQEEAYKILVEKQIIPEGRNQWVYGLQKPIPPNYEIKSFNKTIVSSKFESWLFFIDEDPYANWEHPAKYIFFDIRSGEFETKRATTPPDIIHEMKIFKKYIETRERFLDFAKTNTIACGTSSNKYAVIISGGWNQGSNHIRYWNDCSFVYSTLINKYGYDEANIYTLMSDGTNAAVDISNGTNSNPDLDGDGDNDIQFSATTANITSVFNTLSGILNEDDELFIFTTDHGGVDGSGTSAWDTLLYLWGETITDDQFAIEVNKVNAGKISIVMEQCNSGGFIDDLSGPNRVIATAAKHDELSWAGPTINTDEFVYYWTSAMNEALPSGTVVNPDTNSDGVISKREAFDYAEANDTKPETPQFDETPINLGDQLTLNGTGDLYIKDNRAPYHSVTDSGVEPNTFGGPMWTSRDIWVRQDVDGGTTHENPEYKTTSPNGVYVRVKNRGCAPISDGKLRVYFSKASTGLSWPTHWSNYYDFTPSGSYVLHGDEITSIPLSIPTLNPGDETIIEIPWYPPNPNDFDYDIHHFCLIARIESQIDPIGLETASVNSNTKNNNNIAWKNISVYDVNPSNNINYTNVYIRNIFRKKEDVIDLYFMDGNYGTSTENPFLRNGTVIATMDPELFERWQKEGEGIKIIDKNTVQIYDSKAVMKGIYLKPGESFSMQMQFKLNDNKPFRRPFIFDVVQKNERGIIGGERFDIVYQDKKKNPRQDIITDNISLSIFPNPSNKFLNISFTATKSNTDVSVSIRDFEGNVLISNHKNLYDKGNHVKQVNIESLKKGIYFLRLTMDGKTIVKKIFKR